MNRRQIVKGIKKLDRRISELQNLDPRKVEYDSAEVSNIAASISRTVKEIFGENSDEYKRFQDFIIIHGYMSVYDERYERQQKFADGIPQSIVKLEGLKSLLNEKLEDIVEEEKETKVIQRQIRAKKSHESNKVFIVHGHDEKLKTQVARFLEKLELEAIILSEKPSEGKTIIEKFEANADVGFAVVLLTPDDVGCDNKEPYNLKARARQNVILELGYFIGKLSRKGVCALYKGSIELPSDIHGVLYIQIDDSEGWKLKLAQEIKAAGMKVDLNLLT